MNVIIITPPLVQLNCPYPSGAYLADFFKRYDFDGDQGLRKVKWLDLSIELFYSIFSRTGLTKLFELSQEKALELAEKAEKRGDSAAAFNLRRYISSKGAWIEWIDFITVMLCDGSKAVSGREKAHQFLFSPFVPRGNRMDAFLSGLEREPTVDDVRFLCSYALADLADYITFVFDKDFSLIRYAEEVVAGAGVIGSEGVNPSFAEIEKHIDSPVLRHFYEPVLEKAFCKVVDAGFVCDVDKASSPTLFCISVPFAGTFVPALYTARFIKEKLGASAIISFGGGYVNTELRDFEEPRFSAYADMLSFDRGYGSYIALFRALSSSLSSIEYDAELYKLRLFTNNTVRNSSSSKPTKVLWHDEALEKKEDEVTAEVVPDYSDIDFTRYPRVCDEKNPMHRLWTDGTWIKAYLAHGCYWHKCAFCDTKLDYVCGYKPVNVGKLFAGLKKTAVEKGVYGIHFVDEALPAACLKKFALLNARNGNELYFWGNVRFEKVFTKDLAAFLSYCGFGAVSAGIEVATGTGLKNINKGTDIDSIVSACAAFKEAGILVHAYMIYGFWYDTPQTIIDSMETLRQFFAAGLLDSAFWHKFTLTKNSELYDQLKNSWKGGTEFKKYGRPLEAALDSWMHGIKIEQKVQKWFDFPVPAPTIQRDFVEKAIERYETVSSSDVLLASLDKTVTSSKNPVSLSEDTVSLSENTVSLSENTVSLSDDPMSLSGLTRQSPINNCYWIGSEPVVAGSRNSSAGNNSTSTGELHWYYLQEEHCVSVKELFKKDDDVSADSFIQLLHNLRPETPSEEREQSLAAIKKSKPLQIALQRLHNAGIVFL